MKTEEQNKAIAEACGIPKTVERWQYGWRFGVSGGHLSRAAAMADAESWLPMDEITIKAYQEVSRYPRYTECLNACHEMEANICADDPDGEVFSLYSQFLQIEINERSWPIWYATAKMRSKAFLKAKGLWTETPADNDDE